MESFDLPGRTNELICNIAKVNQNIVLVNQTGTPVAMPWINEVKGVLQAWYLGQEQGNSISDILLRICNPCGKLPVTFPLHIEDNPSYDNFPGENDQVYYGEGIFAGYRHYDHHKIEPLFPFGAGLSYSAFEYSNIRLSSSLLTFSRENLGSIEVSVDVKNIGTRPGKEIVQFYVSQISTSGLVLPAQELKGWDKIYIEPQQTVTARAALDRVAVSYWDDRVSQWVVDRNATFKVKAAKYSRDHGVSEIFHTGEQYCWIN